MRESNLYAEGKLELQVLATVPQGEPVCNLVDKRNRSEQEPSGIANRTAARRAIDAIATSTCIHSGISNRRWSIVAIMGPIRILIGVGAGTKWRTIG